MKELKQFFAYAREREKIRTLREDEGQVRPWTEDPVLLNSYFCNVFREDDRTTRWFAQNIRDPLQKKDAVLVATLIFRWFNYVPTGLRIKDVLLDLGKRKDFSDLSAVVKRLRKILQPVRDGGGKIFTGAYIIRSARGEEKLASILDAIEAAGPYLQGILDDMGYEELYPSLRGVHERLMAIPLIGPFMAYEIVTDLNYTDFLWGAEDNMSWASAGPGAARGLGWVYEGNPIKGPNYQSGKGQDDMLTMMRDLLEEAYKAMHWPKKYREWDMRTVEHSLCEYDKYRRGQVGQQLKRSYRGV